MELMILKLLAKQFLGSVFDKSVDAVENKYFRRIMERIKRMQASGKNVDAKKAVIVAVDEVAMIQDWGNIVVKILLAAKGETRGSVKDKLAKAIIPELEPLGGVAMAVRRSLAIIRQKQNWDALLKEATKIL